MSWVSRWICHLQPHIYQHLIGLYDVLVQYTGIRIVCPGFNSPCGKIYLSIINSHPRQLSLAIPPWVGAMSTRQKAMMLCSWRVKAGMVREWVAVKTVRSLATTGYLSALPITYSILHVWMAFGAVGDEIECWEIKLKKEQKIHNYSKIKGVRLSSGGLIDLQA